MEKVRVTASKEYNEHIGSGFLDNVGEMLASLKRPCRAVIVSDDNVYSLYGEKVKSSLEKCGFTVFEYIVPHGENSKSVENFIKIQEFCAENNITRTDLFVALGGGVVGDLTGFVSSTYLRGVDFVQIPTTVLAMVDSSVGGKTAINLNAGKNLCGAFHQPIAVFADCETLNTLPAETFEDMFISKTIIQNVLHNLEKRDKIIMNLRFMQGKTQTQVADIVGISQAQVSRIEKNIISSVKKQLEI
jgi:3-dehydroquinate synthase